jgi:aminomethyltransferase
VPIGSAVHRRTLPLCKSLNYRDWSGFFAVSAYETHHEHEYAAIRTAAALIDVSPLYKYLITGKQATALVDRLITRDATKLAVGQVVYTTWCDEHGKVIDDGTVSRLGEERYRWTAADPNLRWFQENARGLDVTIRDVSEQVGALALQGPTSAEVLRRVADIDVDALNYFRVTSGAIRGVQVDVSRTGFTGDLGYEIWMRWRDAVKVWDALVDGGQGYGLRPVGMLALDVARIEAGLLLTDVDFFGSRKALIPAQSYSPFEMGLDRLVTVDKAPFVGQAALRSERRSGPARRVVGLEVDWPAVETLFDAAGLPAQPPVTASREAVPVYRGGQQVGKATSMTWSPTLKKLIALATVDRAVSGVGSRVRVEFTIDAVRHRVEAAVVRTPFFNPPRKTATPP